MKLFSEYKSTQLSLTKILAENAEFKQKTSSGVKNYFDATNPLRES